MPKTKKMLKDEAENIFAADTGILVPADVRVGLFLEMPESGEPVTKSDFTLPDATAYPAKVPTLVSDPVLRTDGRRTIVLSGLRWVGVTGQVPVTFKGAYMIDNTSNNNVMAYRQFDAPVVFTEVANAVDLVFRVSLSAPTDSVEVSPVNN